MDSAENKEAAALSSKRSLVIASLAALVGAGILLVTLILPAEYGVDPLGTGAALGVLPLSGTVVVDQSDSLTVLSLTPTIDGPIGHYGEGFKHDMAEFVLEPYEYVEYKYHLEAGATMLYSWTSTDTVIHDFHGDPDENPTAVQSYDMRNLSSGNGSFTAPFTGIHGWYWENPGGNRIIVNVTASGFYAWAVEIHYDGTRLRHDIMALKADAPSAD
ncbi:MAG: hypothetical protein V3S07_06220 [Micropepsaceae bacterium]